MGQALSKIKPLKFEGKVFFLVLFVFHGGNEFYFNAILNLQKDFKNSAKDYYQSFAEIHPLLTFYSLCFIV